MLRVSVILFAAMVSSCARAPIVAEMPISSVRQETSRNYTLGKRMRTNVGESVIRVKDYFLVQISEPFMTPTENFSFMPASSLSFVAGQKYPVKGAVIHAERSWTAVGHPKEIHYTILVSDEGEIHNEVFRQGFGYRGPYPVNPPTARMKRVTEERVETTKPYTNYEIIYNGTDKNSLLFTYREFNPEGLARTAFYQNLTYDANSRSIRFRKFRIQIYGASGEEIDFAILEDDS